MHEDTLRELKEIHIRQNARETAENQVFEGLLEELKSRKKEGKEEEEEEEEEEPE